MSLLRKELVNVVAENKSLQRKIFEIDAMLTKKNTRLELEVDRLRLELAERDRRMEKYENSDSLHGFAVQCRTRRFPKADEE